MSMKVVVLHQSRTGNTKKAAELIGGAVQSSGASVSVRSVSNIDYKELADADLIFVGTWVDGLIMFGHRPGDSGKIKKVPKLWDKKVVAFMTHALNPGNAAEKMASLLEEHGANVLASRSLNRHHLELEAPAFANEALSLFNSVGVTA
jgi:sulfite reductase alpha subunit-like flavoprotein|tara:strand:- start:4262 stop:4705 length:444 start_codon:yes stop_codon:yes gene_type:complete